MEWTPTQTVTAVAMGLQLVGVSVLVWEAQHRRRLFSIDSPPLLDRLAKGLFRLAIRVGGALPRLARWLWLKLRRRRQSQHFSRGIAEGSGGASATFTHTVHVAADNTLEKRVLRLEGQVQAQGAQLTVIRGRLEEYRAEAGRRLDETAARVFKDLNELLEKVKSATSAKEPMHVWGVLAIIVGLLLSISPDEDVTLWQLAPWWVRVASIAALVVGLASVPGT